MLAIEKGRLAEISNEGTDPDKAIGAGDLEEYLRSVRKEAFDLDDENVVLIDPGQESRSRYKDVVLPCDKEQRINNSITAPPKDTTTDG